MLSPDDPRIADRDEELMANGLKALASQRLDDNRPRKKRCKCWNWERAKACVEEDYTGPSPVLFNDRQFERVFRVTRGRADKLLSICANKDAFFTQTKDVVTRY